MKLNRPDGSPVVVNGDHVVQCAPVPESGAGAGPAGGKTRIAYVNGGHQDVNESIDVVEQRLEAL